MVGHLAAFSSRKCGTLNGYEESSLSQLVCKMFGHGLLHLHRFCPAAVSGKNCGSSFPAGNRKKSWAKARAKAANIVTP
jgi:hypothetical protein